MELPLFCLLVGLGCPGLPPLGVGVLDGKVAEEAGEEREDDDEDNAVDVSQLTSLHQCTVYTVYMLFRAGHRNLVLFAQQQQPA